ncbi:UNVERIFIED_CONTAM: anaphase promoting complex subunit cdc16 [Siphonaria sp. JEL0065]|nr:anaphase promoting complex subunit cdc16 [Siphonaria sp. JEL0065]
MAITTHVNAITTRAIAATASRPRPQGIAPTTAANIKRPLSTSLPSLPNNINNSSNIPHSNDNAHTRDKQAAKKSSVQSANNTATIDLPLTAANDQPSVSLPAAITQADRIASWMADALSQGMLASAVYWGQLVLDLMRNSAELSQPHDHIQIDSFKRKRTLYLYTFCRALFLSCDFARIQRVLQQGEEVYRSIVLEDPALRKLLIQSLIKLDKNSEAMALLQEDEDSEMGDPNHQDAHVPFPLMRIKPKAHNLYLKGVIHQSMSERGLAKKCFLDALDADVRCYEAFHVLIQYSLLTVDEEITLLQTLSFATHCSSQDDQLIRYLYSIQLKKYGRTAEVEAHLKILESVYNLNTHATVLQSRADLYLLESKLDLALEKTNNILKTDPTNTQCLQTHISLLVKLKSTNALYLLSHDLVHANPASPVSWYAVGCYYILIQKTPEARSAFSKSCRIDAEFGQGWLGQGHALAEEGSHELAVHAYSVAAKCLTGVHLPTLFIGMQYIQFGQGAIGEEFIKTAQRICGADPVVENELGVAAYSRKELSFYFVFLGSLNKDLGLIFLLVDSYKKAVRHFVKAVKVAGPDACRCEPFDSIWCNLGNAYRYLRFYKRAKICFENALVINPKYATCIACLGIVADRLGNFEDAILHFHQALALDPENALFMDFLTASLSKSFKSSFKITQNDPVFAVSSASSSTPQKSADEDSLLSSWMQKFASSTIPRGGGNFGSFEEIYAPIANPLLAPQQKSQPQSPPKRDFLSLLGGTKAPIFGDPHASFANDSSSDDDDVIDQHGSSSSTSTALPMKTGLLFGRPTGGKTLLLGELGEDDDGFGVSRRGGESSSGLMGPPATIASANVSESSTSVVRNHLEGSGGSGSFGSLVGSTIRTRRSRFESFASGGLGSPTASRGDFAGGSSWLGFTPVSAVSGSSLSSVGLETGRGGSGSLVFGGMRAAAPVGSRVAHEISPEEVAEDDGSIPQQQQQQPRRLSPAANVERRNGVTSREMWRRSGSRSAGTALQSDADVEMEIDD